MDPALSIIQDLISAYRPSSKREQKDCTAILEAMQREEHLLTRANTRAHFTASSWIGNKARTKVLMAYHRIYDAWAWTGGHADGQEDPYLVALKEAKEETGLETLYPLSLAPQSIEILPVAPHLRRGVRVSGHLHYNLSYCFLADEDAPLKLSELEHLGLAWVPLDQVEAKSKEPMLFPVYQKLSERLLAL